MHKASLHRKLTYRFYLLLLVTMHAIPTLILKYKVSILISPLSINKLSIDRSLLAITRLVSIDISLLVNMSVSASF